MCPKQFQVAAMTTETYLKEKEDQLLTMTCASLMPEICSQSSINQVRVQQLLKSRTNRTKEALRKFQTEYEPVHRSRLTGQFQQ